MRFITWLFGFRAFERGHIFRDQTARLAVEAFKARIAVNLRVLDLDV